MSKTLYDKITDTGRKVAGTALQVGSFHPILNIPYVGTGLGGALFEVGSAIKDKKPAKEVLKDAGRGFLIGETVGAIPYVGKGINKVSGGRIGNVLDDAGRYLANTKVGQTVGNYAQSAGNAINKGFESAEDFINTKLRNKQIVYHGSPYDFAKFSNEAIGTGEGAQAHGYGHYTAKKKNVADRYKEGLSLRKGTATYKGKEITDDYKAEIQNIREFGKEGYLNRLNENLANEQQRLKDFENMLENETDLSYFEDLYGFTNGEKHYQDYLDRQMNIANNIIPNIKKGINDIKFSIGRTKGINESDIRGGQLYKLSIPKDDVMLREGATFAEQPKKVQQMYRQAEKNKLQERLKEIQDSKKFLLDELEKAKQTGSDRLIYSTQQMLDESLPSYNKWTNDITEQLKYIDNNNYYDNLDYKALLTNLLPENSRPALERLTDKEAKIVSERLNNAGIKGISYNGGIDGEANVIFNPDDIKIVRKYYNQPDLYNKILGNKQLWTAGTNLLYDYLNE